MSDPSEALLERLIRNAEHVIPRADLAERLAERKRLRVKLGLDPTAKDVTLGWAVPLRKLRQFQDEGHTAVLIVGTFTARIGDPSQKSATRPQLSKEEVEANAESCVAMLLDILSEDYLEVRYNSEWLEPLDMADILRLTAQVTVAQMLERDDFAKRYASNAPIAVHEFLYPILQGYDSVAVQADVELGGTDQLFNLLLARDLQRAHGQPPQIALTMPLLEGLDGVQKMSQSLGNYVSIREAPEEMFGKLMSLPDGLVGRYGRLATDLTDNEIESLEAAALKGGPEAGRAKRAMARSVVSLYHGPDAAEGAEAAFDRQFRRREVPDDIAVVEVPPEAVDGGKIYLPRALASLGLAASGSEARRLIAQGGVKIDGAPVESESVAVEGLRGAVVQVGKRRFVRFEG
ncbi:MAG: tyrosine--tRNA ligase [Actinomycetota bacterium]